MRLGRREESVEHPRIEHAAGLLGFLIYHTGDASLAEEVVAETFEHAQMKPGGVGGSNEKIWLFGIALDRLRDVARRPNPGEGVLAAPVGGEPGAGSDRELVRRAMPTLSEVERVAVALHFGGGLSPGEIAELLEERQSTIDARLYRGSRRLRGEVGDGVDPRATLTAAELGGLRERLDQRVRRMPRGRLVDAFGINRVAVLVAIAIVLTSGAGAVLAAASIGGSPGRGASLGTRLRNTFGYTSFHGTWDASYCQFLGPYSESSTVRLPRGILDVALLWNCGHLIVHVTFPGPIGLSFEDGPAYTAVGSFYDADAPADSTGLTVSAGGTAVTLPFRVVADASVRPSPASGAARGRGRPAVLIT